MRHILHEAYPVDPRLKDTKQLRVFCYWRDSEGREGRGKVRVNLKVMATIKTRATMRDLGLGFALGFALGLTLESGLEFTF